MTSTIAEKIVILFLCGYMAFLPGCSGDDPASSNDPPDIPPIGTMTADFSLFQAGQQALAKSQDSQSNANFLIAGISVLVINSVIILGSVIPVLATAAALSVQPTLEDDGKFHWVFSYPENTPDYSIELTAKVNPEVINWEMLVTHEAQSLDQFKWYDGETQIGDSTGFWQFYDHLKPEQSVQTVRVNWDYRSENKRTLEFIHNEPDHPQNGTTVSYAADNDSVTVEFFDSKKNDTVTISWNRVTGAGYLIAPNHNNGEKACWNDNREDVDCTGP
jgi:hypothetical protein